MVTGPPEMVISLLHFSALRRTSIPVSLLLSFSLLTFHLPLPTTTPFSLPLARQHKKKTHTTLSLSQNLIHTNITISFLRNAFPQSTSLGPRGPRNPAQDRRVPLTTGPRYKFSGLLFLSFQSCSAPLPRLGPRLWHLLHWKHR